MTLPRWLILLASIILFGAGLLHLIGYSFLIPALVKAGVVPGIVGAVKAVWLIFTVELVILSPALVWIGRLSRARSLLLYLSLIPLADAILMYHYVGLFIGTYMVAGGALLLLAGAWLLPHGETPAAK